MTSTDVRSNATTLSLALRATRFARSPGPVVVKLVPTSEHWPTPITVSGGLPEFAPSLNSTSAYFTGAFDASQFVGPLANTSMADFIKQVEASEENFYVNVHNDANPAGVVRAQLKAVGPSPAPRPSPSPTPSPSPSPSAATVPLAGMAAAVVTGALALM